MRFKRTIGFLGRMRESEAHSMQDDERSAIGGNGGPPLAVDWRQYGGFIVEAREARNHHLVGYGKPVKPADPDRGSYSVNEAWRDLLHECKYKDGYLMNGGHKMVVKRGELVGAISWLAARWNWTPKTVRGFLDKLEADGMIARFARSSDGFETPHKKGNQQGNQSAVISICNYEKFQGLPDAEGQSEGQSRGNQGAIEGQSKGNIYKEEQRNKGTKEPPPTPQGGAGEVSGLKPATDKVRELFGDEPNHKEVTAREIEEAFAIYNLAAEHFGFAKCGALTQARRTRLGKRLADLGGLENYKAALRALKKNDPFVLFLRGKAMPRPGDKPFKLDIDRLMQTDGGLGDVLAKLWDLGDAPTAPAAPAGKATRFWQDAAAVSAMTHAQWRELVAKHVTSNVWPINEVGPAPGSPLCVIPPEIIAEFRLAERFDERGVQRFSWGKS